MRSKEEITEEEIGERNWNKGGKFKGLKGVMPWMAMNDTLCLNFNL